MNFVGFLLEVFGPWEINQWEAELAAAQASRAGVSLRASGHPPGAGLFPLGMCSVTSATTVVL